MQLRISELRYFFKLRYEIFLLKVHRFALDASDELKVIGISNKIPQLIVSESLNFPEELKSALPH